MSRNEIVDFLLTGDELDFAQIFVKYWKVATSSDEYTGADKVDLTADDMNHFDLDGFIDHMRCVLDEVIFSEEIEASAWWKEKRA